MADLFSDFPSPPVALAPAELVRRRGEQRRTRTRAAVGVALSLVVLAVSGTALALNGGSGRPDSLQVATSGTPTPSATSKIPHDPKVTWAAFPSVTRMNELFPGDWTSGQVQDDGAIADADRCDRNAVLAKARAMVVRALNTPASDRVVFNVEDFATDAVASGALADHMDGYRRCPVVPRDGPGAGSQEMSTIVESSADAFTVRIVQRQCQKDHADCTDSPLMWREAVVDHELLIVTGRRPVGATFSASDMRVLMTDFAQRVHLTYGRPAPGQVRPATVDPQIGSSYYAVFLWTGNVGQTSGQAEAQRQSAGWDHVLTTHLDCLTGGPAVVSRDTPGSSHGDVVVVFFTSAQQAEQFLNVYDGYTEGVGTVTVRCLG